ncbi:MAG: hypothetical protein ACT4QA_07145 [Panacagrimonas sp.]
MTWKQAIQAWRQLAPEQRQQQMLARSPLQTWQSMAFEREPVSLDRLKAQHARLTQPSPDSTPRSES